MAALALAILSAHSGAAPAADAPAGDAKAAPAQPAPPPKAATIRSAMADVGDISVEVKKLEKRLEAIDQSVAAINVSLKRIESMEKSLAAVSKSLEPVGVLTQPEGLTSLVKAVSEEAYDRGVALILVGTGCAAGLIVLFALLRRWNDRARAQSR